MDTTNPALELAENFINQTNCSGFLTGKAGTGKTTFLRQLQNTCSKNMVIVAPTGVAAINAGGMTLHSLFQLPFGLYTPERKNYFGNDNLLINDANSLLSNLRMNKTKIDLSFSKTVIPFGIYNAFFVKCGKVSASGSNIFTTF